MSVGEALVFVVIVATVFTLLSGAGWFIVRRWPVDAEHYVTVARLEAVLTQQQARHDAAMLAMDRRLEASVARQDVLERELDEEREKRRADHTRIAESQRLIAELQRLIEVWMSYARQLAEIIRRELKTEPPQEPAAPAPPAPQPHLDNDSVALAKKIAKRFSIEDINELAFELGVEGSLTGETLERRASSLVTVAQQRELMPRLIELCREKRPKGEW